MVGDQSDFTQSSKININFGGGTGALSVVMSLNYQSHILSN